MTFGQLLSNREQMEAHELAFEKEWIDCFFEGMIDTFPQYKNNPAKISEMKFNCFVHYMEQFVTEKDSE